MKRRGLFGLLGSALVPWLGAKPAEAASTAADPQWQLSPIQWRSRLSAEAFSVLRQDGTQVELGRLTKLMTFSGLDRVPVEHCRACAYGQHQPQYGCVS